MTKNHHRINEPVLAPEYCFLDGTCLSSGKFVRADLADPGGMPLVRRAAKFGASGAVASTSWAPTGQSWAWEVTVCVDVGATAFTRLIHGTFAGAPNLHLRGASGDLEFRYDTTTLASVDWTPYAGVPARVRIEVDPGVVTLKVNGVTVDVGPQPTTWGTTPATTTIGKASGFGNSFPGYLYDVLFEDPTNSAFFPLDGTDSSGNYPNTLSGSTVADATVSGFVPSVVVNSTEGSSGAVFTGGPHLVQMSRDATIQSMDGSSASAYTVTYNALDLDQTGGADEATGIWTAPASGAVTLSFDARVGATTALDTLSVQVRRDGTTVRTIAQDATAGARLVLSAALAVEAGDEVSVRIADIDASNTALGLDFAGLTLTFYPS